MPEDDTIHDIPWISVIERLEEVENRLEDMELQADSKLDISWKGLLAFLMICSTTIAIVMLVWGGHG